MARLLLVSALLIGTATIASADNRPLLAFDGLKSDRVCLDLDSVFDRVIGAVRLGVSAGKLVLLRRASDGRREELAVDVGKSRLTPLFDVSTGGASALLRFRF